MIFNSCYTSRSNEQYFDYNKVEHYYLEETHEKGLMKINKKEPKTEEEKSMLDLYFGKDELQFSDSIKILNSIHLINYTKHDISVEDIHRLKKIFRNRQISESYDYMCFREYRDILVFKYNNSISGIALICFKCKQNEIIGTNINTLDFGQKGNYEKLQKILYK